MLVLLFLLFSGISCYNSSNHPTDNNVAIECAVYSVSIVHIFRYLLYIYMWKHM